MTCVLEFVFQKNKKPWLEIYRLTCWFPNANSAHSTYLDIFSRLEICTYVWDMRMYRKTYLGFTGRNRILKIKTLLYAPFLENLCSSSNQWGYRMWRQEDYILFAWPFEKYSFGDSPYFSAPGIHGLRQMWRVCGVLLVLLHSSSLTLDLWSCGEEWGQHAFRVLSIFQSLRVIFLFKIWNSEFILGHTEQWITFMLLCVHQWLFLIWK